MAANYLLEFTQNFSFLGILAYLGITVVVVVLIQF
jgi:hypothetical protein